MSEQASPIQFGPGLVLHRRLGAGGMAEVFRAVQTGVGGFQKVVAVKRMLPNLADAEDFEKMFQAEVNLTARLQHPNIVQVFGNGEYDGFLYVVMEYVNGRDLAKILSVLGQRGESLPMPIAVMIAAEVARGLDYAHTFSDPATNQRECLVHRDISPQNIMVSFDGQVKVVDFGIAKVTDGVEATRTGTIRGKLAYMAPEQAAGEAFDHRIDIFALGVVLHESLTGARLFRGANQADTLRKVLKCEVAPPSAKNPLVPPELDAIVMKALARESSDRYASAYELQRDLSVWLGANAAGLVPREVGAFMSAIFADSISADRDTDRLISSERAPTTNTPSGSLSRASVSQSSRSGSQATRVLVVPAAAPPPKSSSAAWLALFLGVVLIGVLGYRVIEGGGTATPKLPTQVEGLVAWFRADTIKQAPNTRVARWTSAIPGGGVDAVQPDEARQPIFQPSVVSGSPVVAFDGKTQFFTADGVAASLQSAEALSFVFVARVTDDRAQFVLAVQQEDSNVDIARIGFKEPGLIRLKISPKVGVAYLDSPPQLLFGFAVYTVVVSKEESVVYFAGKEVIRRQTELPEFPNARRLSIGQEYDERLQPSDFFAGQIAELAVFAKALTRSERQNIEAYLTKKYALQN